MKLFAVLPTNKTFEGIFFKLFFSSKEVLNYSLFETVLHKSHLT